MMKNACTLPSLSTKDHFEELLDCFVVDPSFFRLNPKLFPCCEGEGHVLLGEQNAMLRCSVRERFRNVQKLVLEIAKYFPDQDPMAILRHSNEKVSEFKLARLVNAQRTHAAIERAKYGEVSEMWSLVLRWIWQYGLPVSLISFTKAAKKAVFIEESFLQKTGPRLLFVYGIDHLWDQPYVDALEYLIGFAEQSGFQIFLLFQPQSPRQSSEGQRKRGMIQRVAELKEKDPLTFLTDHIRSRLMAMTGETWLKSTQKNPDTIDMGF